MESRPGRAATIAGAAGDGEAPFASFKVGQLRAGAACSEPGTLTIRLEGELDIASTPPVEDLFREIERDRWPNVVLDLRHLSFIDSTGIRALLGANNRIGRVGGHMVLCHATRDVRRTLAVIGLDRILDLADDLDDPR